jgi:hypothetical protein
MKMPLSIPEVRAIWVRNGGSPALAPIAVGVASAESGRITDNISPSSDYGLWQINSTNFGHLGLDTVSALDPDRNAVAAITMSGNGTNWAAWCTCWQDPFHNCGYGYLPVPQRDTPAWDGLLGAIAVLQSQPFEPAPAVSSTNTTGLIGTWSLVTDFYGSFARRIWADLNGARSAIRRVPL